VGLDCGEVGWVVRLEGKGVWGREVGVNLVWEPTANVEWCGGGEGLWGAYSSSAVRWVGGWRRIEGTDCGREMGMGVSLGRAPGEHVWCKEVGGQSWNVSCRK